MSRRCHAQPLTPEETATFPQMFTTMFHDTLTLMRLLRRLDAPRYRGMRRFMERRALKLRRGQAMGGRCSQHSC